MLSITTRILLPAALLLLASCEAERKEQATTASAEEPGWAVPELAKEVVADARGQVTVLPKTLHPHWVWVADFAASSMPDGRAYLYDGDQARLLGMLNTGYSFNALNIPRHYREVYSAETYYSRTTRGRRTDVVSIYDPFLMTPLAEIEIPAKRVSTIPRLGDSALTDDDRFMAVFNLTPASSLSIVDVQERRFVGEIATAGCAMAFAAGARRFISLCGDGSLLQVDLTDTGAPAELKKSRPFFDVHQDPVLDTAERHGDAWYFVSVLGNIHEADVSGEAPVIREPWQHLSERERKADWRIGGVQPVAVHQGRNELYLLMHQGDFYSYEAPGPEIWVYDLVRRERLRKITTRQPSISIAVSQDEAPLLYAITEDLSALDIYDADSGKFLRSAPELGIVPALLQVPPLPVDRR